MSAVARSMPVPASHDVAPPTSLDDIMRGICLPEQYWGGPGMDCEDGERALLFAVLETGCLEALGEPSLLFIDGKTSTRMKTRIVTDARRWLFSNDRSRLTAFLRLCEELRINPAPIRRAISARISPFCPCAHCTGEES